MLQTWLLRGQGLVSCEHMPMLCTTPASKQPMKICLSHSMVTSSYDFITGQQVCPYTANADNYTHPSFVNQVAGVW